MHIIQVFSKQGQQVNGQHHQSSKNSSAIKEENNNSQTEPKSSVTGKGTLRKLYMK